MNLPLNIASRGFLTVNPIQRFVVFAGNQGNIQADIPQAQPVAAVLVSDMEVGGSSTPIEVSISNELNTTITASITTNNTLEANIQC